MKANDNQTLEFLYQETEIHFLVNPKSNNVMVNATEMAKLFGKRIDVFLKAEHTKKFIKELEEDYASFPPYGGNEKAKILETNVNTGTFMDEILALKFAAWLDVKFELWVYKRINEVIFGSLKKYRDAMAEEVRLKNLIPTLKQNLIDNPTQENVKAFFENEESINKVKKEKNKARTNQLNLFKDFYKEKEETNVN